MCNAVWCCVLWCCGCLSFLVVVIVVRKSAATMLWEIPSLTQHSAGSSSSCYSLPLQLLPLAVPPFATPLLGGNPRVLSTSRSSKVVLYLKAQFTLICTVIILTTFQTIQLMLQQLEAAPVTAWSCFTWRLYVQLRTETKGAHSFSYFNIINWGMYNKAKIGTYSMYI